MYFVIVKIPMFSHLFIGSDRVHTHSEEPAKYGRVRGGEIFDLNFQGILNILKTQENLSKYIIVLIFF